MLYTSFLVITLLCLLLLYKSSDGHKRVLLYSAIWISLVSLLALADYFQVVDTFPPRFIVVVLGNLVYIVLVFQLLKDKKISFNLAMLIHGLRIPVEFVLYYLFIQNKVPEIMTFKGWNYDIISGISALLLLMVSLFSKTKIPNGLLLVWNLIGLILLIIIVTIAILSAPLPFQKLAFDQPNTAVLEFPYILLPSFIVPVVFLMHLISIRQLINKSK